MTTIYSYGGRPYQRHGDQLHDAAGRHIGRFKDALVYDTTGQYLGELRNGKLARNPQRASRRTGASTGQMSRIGTAAVSHVATVLPAGWEDFGA